MNTCLRFDVSARLSHSYHMLKSFAATEHCLLVVRNFIIRKENLVYMFQVPTHTISRFAIILCALLSNIILSPRWWNHRSTGGDIWGRYSESYTAFLIGTLIVLLGWAVLLIRRDRIFDRMRYVLWGALLVGMGITLYVAMGRYEPQVVGFLSFNVCLLTIVVFYPMENTTTHRRLSIVIIGILLLFMAVSVVIMSLRGRPFSPDEAIWADIATSWRVNGGLYYSTANYLHMTLFPGVGWINALYGELLWLADVDIRVGRVFRLVVLGMATVSLAMVANKLYGRFAGLVVIVVLLIGSPFFRAVDYRPDHFIILAQGLIFYCLVSAWQTPTGKPIWHWYMLAGLLVTGSMQLHAIGLTYAIGVSLFVAGEVVWSVYRRRQLNTDHITTLLAFGTGAAIGTAIYFFANILSVGGLDTYLTMLVDGRGTLARSFDYLQSWSLMVTFLQWNSIAFLLWRRRSNDVRYLSLIGCMVFAIFIVDTQGYVLPYSGLFLIPIGALIADGFVSRRWWVLTILALAIFPQNLLWIDFQIIQSTLVNRTMPPHSIELIGRDIQARVEFDAETVIVSTHELIWVLAEHDNFHAIASEGIMPKQRSMTPSEVWETIQPELYIELPTRATTTPALTDYLEREGFVVCQEFTTYNTPVIIHRRTCD